MKTPTTAQQNAIDAVRAFFLEGAPWEPAQETLEIAYAETGVKAVKNPPPGNRLWLLDTIVRDAYFNLRFTGLTHTAALNALADC